MQQRIIISKKGKFLVNVASMDDGIGAGFSVGQLLLKSISDSYWYMISTSGSAGAVTTYVSQSELVGLGTSSHYDINYPYQLVGCDNGNTYAVYLTGTAPSATIVVSQSAYTGSSDPKPYLLLQNITDFNYYQAYLTTSASVIILDVNQTPISQSWVKPIY